MPHISFLTHTKVADHQLWDEEASTEGRNVLDCFVKSSTQLPRVKVALHNGKSDPEISHHFQYRVVRNHSD